MDDDDVEYSLDYFDPYLVVNEIICLPPRATDRFVRALVTLVEYIDHERTNVKLTKYDLTLWVTGRESKEELLKKIHAAFVSAYYGFALPDVAGEEISLKIDTRSHDERVANANNASAVINNKEYKKAYS